VAYCASKFAVRGLSKALDAELDGSSINVSVIYPGGVAKTQTLFAVADTPPRRCCCNGTGGSTPLSIHILQHF
jgi:NAD(P)-dependent dehydrogenase (short-subunit alcohol dehydrogenase family)